MYDLAVNIIKGALVGAAIGYFTNDIAVRMLFRPRKQWHLFGWPVPFTPGIVVRHQEDLAQAVGRTVSGDLLDTETLVAHLRGVRLREPIRAALDAERAALLATDKSPLELAGPQHRAAMEAIRRQLAEAAVEKAERLLRGGSEAILPERVQNTFGPLANLPLANLPLERFLPAPQRALLATWLQRQAARLASQPEVHSAAAAMLADLLRDFPNSEAFAALRETAARSLGERIPATTAGIQRSLGTFVHSEAFATVAQERLGFTLYEMLAAKFPRVAPFIGDRPIRQMLVQRWDVVTEQLEAILAEQAVAEFLHNQLLDGSEQILGALETTAADRGAQEKLAIWLADRLAEKLPELLRGETAHGLILRGLERIARTTPAELAEQVFGSGGLGDVSGGLADALAGKETRAAACHALEGAIDRLLLDQEVSRLMALIPDEEWDMAATAVSGLIEERILGALPGVLRTHLDLAAIVSGKVREFDPAQIEETIQQVSGKQLKAIVNLGAVLGFLVGGGAELIAWLMKG